MVMGPEGLEHSRNGQSFCLSCVQQPPRERNIIWASSSSSYLGKRVCKMFSESSTTILNLPFWPSKAGERTLNLFTKTLTQVTAHPSKEVFVVRCVTQWSGMAPATYKLEEWLAFPLQRYHDGDREADSESRLLSAKLWRAAELRVRLRIPFHFHPPPPDSVLLYLRTHATSSKEEGKFDCFRREPTLLRIENNGPCTSSEYFSTFPPFSTG